jgi:subtilisin family serine protease
MPIIPAFIGWLPLRPEMALALVAATVAGSTPVAAQATQQTGLTRIAVGYTQAALSTVRTVETALGAQPIATLGDIDAHVVGVSPARAAAVVSALDAVPGVRYVQLDGRAYAAGVPDDEFWPQEWSPEITHAPQAWDLTTGSPSVAVAVVDTGVDATQPDLQGRVLPGYDFVNGDTDANDDNGHGTAVAGVVAAAGNNGIGVAGYCWQCRILPVKVLGSDGTGFNSWVASGILWAVDHGAKVINTSLGSTTDDLTVSSAAQYAASHGVLLVAAAGNDGSATLEYPAALPGVISVSASDQNDQPYSFSNTGATVAAPGENVTAGLNGSYVSFLGTSSAAPVVSGIAALAFSAAPTATAAQVSQAIESTAVPAAGVVDGRVDAYATVHAVAPGLTAAPSGPPAPPVTVGFVPAPSDASSSGQRTRARLEVRGTLTDRHRRRAYAIRTAIGRLEANVSVGSPEHIRLVVKLVAPNGATVATRSGAGSLHLTATVDPMRYRLVVSRRGAGAPLAYRAIVVFPDPANLDSPGR